jgi:hypothetical protein
VKFRITMKDPDGFHDSVEEAVKEMDLPGLSEDEAELVREARTETIKKLLGRWFEYGEYLTVEVDTDAKTCTVIEVGK